MCLGVSVCLCECVCVSVDGCVCECVCVWVSSGFGFRYGPLPVDEMRQNTMLRYDVFEVKYFILYLFIYIFYI